MASADEKAAAKTWQVVLGKGNFDEIINHGKQTLHEPFTVSLVGANNINFLTLRYSASNDVEVLGARVVEAIGPPIRIFLFDDSIVPPPQYGLITASGEGITWRHLIG